MKTRHALALTGAVLGAATPLGLIWRGAIQDEQKKTACFESALNAITSDGFSVPEAVLSNYNHGSQSGELCSPTQNSVAITLNLGRCTLGNVDITTKTYRVRITDIIKYSRAFGFISPSTDRAENTEVVFADANELGVKRPETKGCLQ